MNVTYRYIIGMPNRLNQKYTTTQMIPVSFVLKANTIFQKDQATCP